MFLEAMNKYEPRVTKESKGCATISVGEFFDFLSVHPLLKKTPCSLFGTNHQEMLDEFYLTKFDVREKTTQKIRMMEYFFPSGKFLRESAATPGHKALPCFNAITLSN